MPSYFLFGIMYVKGLKSLLVLKLRRKWQAKPKFSPRPLSNPTCTLTLVQAGHKYHYTVMNLINHQLGLGAFVSNVSNNHINTCSSQLCVVCLHTWHSPTAFACRDLVHGSCLIAVYRSPIALYSSENDLPTFRLNASVVIRAKVPGAFSRNVGKLFSEL